MIFLVILGIVLISLFSFSLSAGFIFLQNQIKPYNSRETLSEEKSAMPGMPSDLSEHVRDPKIIKPLLAAKNRWANYPIETVEKKSFDLKTIYADFWENESEKNVSVILVHGHLDSARGMAYLAEAYFNKGYSVLSIDMRGHGKSALYSSFGYKDAKDLLIWIDFLVSKFGKEHKILLHGVSLGSSTILRALSLKQLPENNISLAIVDSAFSSFIKQMKSQMDFLLPKSPLQNFIKKLLLFGLDLSNFLVQGFFFSQHAPKKYLKKRNKAKNKSIPIVFFHGEKDKMVGPQMSEELFFLANEPKKLVFVKEAPHIGSYFYEPELYMAEIESLLE